MVAGHIVTIGYTVIATTLFTLLLVWRLTRGLAERSAAAAMTVRVERT